MDDKRMIGVELGAGFVAHVAQDVSVETVDALMQMKQCLVAALPAFVQPGDADQLARVIEAAERYYERSRQAIVVYWNPKTQRYQMDYLDRHLPKQTTQVEVVRIPK